MAKTTPLAACVPKIAPIVSFAGTAVITVIAVFAQVVARPAAATGLREWSVYGGVYNVNKTPTSTEGGFELRFPTRWSGLDAVGGAAGTEDGSFWAYGGVLYRWRVGERLSIIPGLAISLYEEGDGKDLGGLVEFRTSLEASFRTSAKTRLGVAVYHLSNAGFYDLNPGSNSAVLVWTYVPGGD